MYLLKFLLLIYIFNNIALTQEYNVKFNQINESVWYVNGEQEEANFENGGAIANIGLIIGQEACLVIDSGPSKKYGEALLKEILNITKVPVKYLVITHRHFDHSFGLEAFAERNIDIYMHPDEFRAYKTQGPKFLKLLKKNIGDDWLDGTFSFLEQYNIIEVRDNISLNLGSHNVEILNFGNAHTHGDIAIFDKKTGSFFAGDLVFINRAATTPESNILKWIKKLNYIENTNWKSSSQVMVK